jgi:hypothetical protein
MVEVTLRLTDEGQLEVGLGGQQVSPLVLIGMLEAGKQIVLNRKPEPQSNIVLARTI